jgi:ACS family hexuronate transporter-like MFS transporter
METTTRSPAWKWTICGLLFLATMMMYMDRQTLAESISRIMAELHLDETHYGQMEKAFGLSFALGAIVLGIVADRVSIRWLYPAVLIGWSSAGIATAYGDSIGESLVSFCPWLLDPEKALLPEYASTRTAFLGMYACRIVLGFFEAGHWPCALITTQRILSARDRTFGNGLLQSGASVGAVLTPIVIYFVVTSQTGSWRFAFQSIGFIGMFWIIPWLLLIRDKDLQRPPQTTNATKLSSSADENSAATIATIRRFFVLLAIVIPINLTWQFFRAWMPLILESRGYEKDFIPWFRAAFFLVADVGCIAAGMLSKHLAERRGWTPHAARSLAFVVCALLTTASMLAGSLPHGWLLLASFLVLGFGSLGLFPPYYSLTQEISKRHQGLVTGTLGCLTWIASSYMQEWVGNNVKAKSGYVAQISSFMQELAGNAGEATDNYGTALFFAGMVPLLGCVALIFWGSSPTDEKAAPHA